MSLSATAWDMIPLITPREVGELCNELLTSLQSVVLERNELHEKYIRATQERDDYLDAQVGG